MFMLVLLYLLGVATHKIVIKWLRSALDSFDIKLKHRLTLNRVMGSTVKNIVGLT